MTLSRMNDTDTMTDNEHAHVRGYLRAFVLEHPARAPLSIRILDWTESMFRIKTNTQYSRGRFAGIAAVLVLFASVGTSYAAQGSLPGDALYAVKVNVNEKVASVMAITPVARAQFDAGLAERRLEEVEILAAAHRLTPEMSVELHARINEATASFAHSLIAIAESDANSTAVEDAQSDLEATFAAHANVLVALTEVVPETKDALGPIISTVESHVASAREARNQAGAALMLSSTTASSKEIAARAEIATQKKESARRALGDVRVLAGEMTAEAHSSSSDPIAKKVQRVEKMVEIGNEYLNNGEYDKALGAFQTVIRATAQAQTEAAVSIELEKILPALQLETTTTIDAEMQAEIKQGLEVEHPTGGNGGVEVF